MARVSITPASKGSGPIYEFLVTVSEEFARETNTGGGDADEMSGSMGVFLFESQVEIVVDDAGELRFTRRNQGGSDDTFLRMPFAQWTSTSALLIARTAATTFRTVA